MKRRQLLLTSALALPFAIRTATALELEQCGSRLIVDLDEAAPKDLSTLVQPWIDRSANAVCVYYGRFPVPAARLELRVVAGSGVKGGQSFPGETPLIRLRLGSESTERQLMHDDWVLVHEMTHLAFPWLDLRHNWMAEGLAVYVESIARVQAGHLPAEQIWGDFVTSMPKGQPRPGEGGLDETPSWGRTYWGGALYCLVCDLRIRQQTGNAKGLQHALRTINAERDFRREWPFRETLELGDKATGCRVLVETYDEMRETPVTVDLARLWSELGVRSGSSVTFDDTAPLAAIRRAITVPIS
jgi:hypothetical protein